MVRALSLLALCALAICTSAEAAGDTVSKSCSAQWMLVATLENSQKRAVLHNFHYHVGLRSLHNAHKVPWETLISISVTTQILGDPHGVSEFISTDLGRPRATLGSVLVPAKSVAKIWQLVVRTHGEVFKFRRTKSVRGSQSPPPILSCHASYQVKRRITEQSWVHLKHESSNMYLVTTNRRGWDAGTLGSSASNKFRFQQIRPGTYRIVAYSYRFSGYRYLYSSMAGGIYLDDSDLSNEKQLWTLDRTDLREGDSIAIQNVYYPGGYMIKYEGSTTNVFCEYTNYPDRWIVELAD